MNLTVAFGIRAVSVALTFAVLANTACSTLFSGREDATLLWSYDPDGYFADADFTQASHFSTSGVIVTKQAHSTLHSKRAVRLDPNTGEALWTLEQAGWVLHAEDSLDPLYVIDSNFGASADDDLSYYFRKYQEIHQVDPETGKTIRVLPIDSGEFEPPTVGCKFYLYGETVYYLQNSTVTAIDLKDGRAVRQFPVDSDGLFSPVFTGNIAIFPGSTYEAYDLQTGQRVFATPGACCTVLVSPDGQHIYVRKEVGVAALLGKDGSMLKTYAGEIRAVTNRFAAVVVQGDPKDPEEKLQVYEHGSAEPYYEVSSTGRDAFYTAVALHDKDLFYFFGKDDYVWHVDLDRKKGSPIIKIGSKFVISPDATGVAPAIITEPPVYDPPLLFINDWTIRAYRVE